MDNLKLRKGTKGKFDQIKEEDFTTQGNKGWVKEEGEYDIDKKGVGNLDLYVA